MENVQTLQEMMCVKTPLLIVCNTSIWYFFYLQGCIVNVNRVLISLKLFRDTVIFHLMDTLMQWKLVLILAQMGLARN